MRVSLYLENLGKPPLLELRLQPWLVVERLVPGQPTLSQPSPYERGGVCGESRGRMSVCGGVWVSFIMQVRRVQGMT